MHNLNCFTYTAALFLLSKITSLSALIGRPDFEIKVSEEESKITLHIIDPLSAVYHGERLLNMRDIFKEDLMYRVVYRKAKTTGRVSKKSLELLLVKTSPVHR